jgi:phage I-like protein
MKPFGWWVDLTKINTLSDTGAATTWIHALPFGKYQHPIYGEMDFDQAKLSALANSVTTKVRGIDPDIDYDHKQDPAKGNQAAGWVKDAQVRTDGLYIQVDFTADAAKEVADKKYRYFSADFADTWTDPQGVEHKDVLMGGGLTNRPYMKNLMPVNLSELRFDEPPEEESTVDPKQLRASLGLAESATDAEVLAKATEAVTSVTTLTAEKAALEAEVKTLKEPETDQIDPELRKLVEASPAMKKMLDEHQAQIKKNQELAAALRLSEVNGQLAEVQKGKQFAIAPVAKETLKQLMLKSSPAAAKELAEFMSSVVNGTGLVDLSERGFGGREQNTSDANLRFAEAVKQLMEADKNLTYADAVEHIASAQPHLFNEYRESTYSFKS